MPRNNYAYSDKLRPYARENRHSPTHQERELWYRFLRNYPVKIYRQRMIGVYIADFYCAAAKLIIELDGNQHHTEEGLASDRNRTAALGEFLVEVIRFSNEQVDNHFNEVCQVIDRTIKERMKTKKKTLSQPTADSPLQKGPRCGAGD
ncbi:MAG: DUF559 domain-containing protein [Clostridia bacterium]|nr:DUF559 domain-containing protein [Clostridia bacterium]